MIITSIKTSKLEQLYYKIIILFIILFNLKKPTITSIKYHYTVTNYMKEAAIFIIGRLTKSQNEYDDESDDEIIYKYFDLLINLNNDLRNNKLVNMIVLKHKHWYNMQKLLIDKMPGSINKLIQHDMIHPKIKKEFPYIIYASELNLL